MKTTLQGKFHLFIVKNKSR